MKNFITGSLLLATLFTACNKPATAPAPQRAKTTSSTFVPYNLVTLDSPKHGFSMKASDVVTYLQSNPNIEWATFMNASINGQATIVLLAADESMQVIILNGDVVDHSIGCPQMCPQ